MGLVMYVPLVRFTFDTEETEPWAEYFKLHLFKLGSLVATLGHQMLSFYPYILEGFELKN